MAVECKGIEYTATAEVGLHGSRWWAPGKTWDQAVCTYDFLWAHLKNKAAPDGIRFCTEGTACKSGDKCLPTSFTVTVTSGKADLKEVTAEIDHETYHSHLMVVKEQATITVKTSCACVTPPKTAR